jgi:hypothetical protein
VPLSIRLAYLNLAVNEYRFERFVLSERGEREQSKPH